MEAPSQLHLSSDISPKDLRFCTSYFAKSSHFSAYRDPDKFSYISGWIHVCSEWFDRYPAKFKGLDETRSPTLPPSCPSHPFLSKVVCNYVIYYVLSTSPSLFHEAKDVSLFFTEGFRVPRTMAHDQHSMNVCWMRKWMTEWSVTSFIFGKWVSSCLRYQ